MPKAAESQHTDWQGAYRRGDQRAILFIDGAICVSGESRVIQHDLNKNEVFIAGGKYEQADRHDQT
ncbi:hypothetical protein [Paraburkholderia eburnea]|uniref:hypothetical protein n=1 Tax=Paraburkholderia eburnea TaxID=1189126 RepID=UPI00142E1135|nr:hypothetical protein [Paraburkholderia eburnea]